MAVMVIKKDGLSLYAPDDDVINHTRRINVRLGWNKDGIEEKDRVSESMV